MHDVTVKSLQHILKRKSHTLQHLIRHSRQLQQLNIALQDLLAAPLKQHCQISNVKGKTLTLQVDSPAWAAKLRMLTPQLLRVVQNRPGLAQVRHVKVRIAPRSRPAVEKPGTRKRLSSSTARQIARLAEGARDPDIQAALLRLSRHMLDKQ
jgi:hypothetical protein